MILVIDAGNTRIKWGVHDGNAWQAKGVAASDDIATLEASWQVNHAVERAILSSVAGPQVNAALDRFLSRLGITSFKVMATPHACGVTNGYDAPEKLGVDRWAALIAAWQARHEACVVVSAGTAMTVDALSSRVDFLGGLIVPGLTMMKSALMRDTASVGFLPGEFKEFPSCTGDAVHSGTVRAMAGAVRHMMDTLVAREGRAPALILSGGDALILQQALSGAGEIMDNLVLDGLLLLAKEVST